MNGTPPDGRLAIVIASCFYDLEERDPDAILDRYHATSGWASALLEAGARSVTVLQRFSRDALIRRDGVDYQLISDGGPNGPPPWFWGSRFVRRVESLRPDVVHFDGLIYPLVVRHLRWRLPGKASIVVQDHGGFGENPASFRSRRGRAFYRFGLSAADGFLFTSRPQAASSLTAGIISSAGLVHEMPEASTDLGSWTIDPTAPRLPGRPALLWVGRLNANKDPLTILDGFERAVPAIPDVALTMVYGDDALLPETQARIAGSPVLRGRVHLRGRLERRALAPVYAGADLFVIGSHHEIACFSLIEALSFGLTPVVTELPAHRALTDDGRVGALFPPGDAPALARALETVARSDLEERRRAVRAHFDARLSWSAVGRRAMAIYAAAAARRARA